MASSNLAAVDRPERPGLAAALLLVIVFAAAAFLVASGIYLAVLRLAEWLGGSLEHTLSSVWVFLLHVVIGLLVLLLLLVLTLGRNCGLRIADCGLPRSHPPSAILLLVVLVTGVSGVMLIQLDGLPRLPGETLSYWLVYGLHVAAPLAGLALVGWGLKRKWLLSWGGAVMGLVAALLAVHGLVSGRSFGRGSPEGEAYFEPSSARTVDGKYIPAQALMTDDYCRKCHEDAYRTHYNSAHHFSSFTNPAYLFSVKATRERAGIKASRWCAGCHDPVPFFSGQFDDPHYDFVNNPTAGAGITCTSCHSVTHVNSRSGNGDYTIEEPRHYPFAYSDQPLLQWLNHQLVKARPQLHRKTFLKPFHRTEEFCSTCHKVGLPQEVNRYKEFLRGQNHADSFLLSGASGHGARSFYYPPQAKGCAECHLPLVPSNDRAGRDRDGSGVAKVHSHLFPGANTGIHGLVEHPGAQQTIAELRRFLQEGLDGQSPALRIDLFGLKKGDRGVEAPLLDNQPLRPHLPALQPGETYLVEVVIRTLNMGHHFTQGTVDFNEVWVDFTAQSGDRLLGRSGGLDQGEDQGRVDEWAHFINAIILDRHGNRIDRHNPEDIFTPLYDHQIPPGAAQVVHYRLPIPADVTTPVELSARVRYRKFDYPYMEYTYGRGKVPKLPIVDLCSDRVMLPVAGVAAQVPAQESPIKPAWQRWNDYGIACFLEGGPDGKGGGELSQAEAAFRRLLTAEFQAFPESAAHGHLNLARVHLAYGGSERLEMARQALQKARDCQPPAPWQVVAWFSGLVNVQHGHFDEAVVHFEQILDPQNRDRKRRFDFTKDFIVINELGKTLFWRSQQEDDPAKRDPLLLRAVAQFEKTLQLEAENVAAHEFLHKCFARLAGESQDQPALPQDLSPEETLLLGVARSGGILRAPNASRSARLAVLRETVAVLDKEKALQLSEPRPFGSGLRLAVLVQAHQEGSAAAAATADVWLQLGLAPYLERLDRLLLARVLPLGQTAADGKVPRAQRLAAAAELWQVLVRLGERPPRPDLVPYLASATAWPHPSLPGNLALAGLASDGHLQGPLPGPRLLILGKVRPALRALFAQDQDRDLQMAAGRVLARMHLLQHGIFKADENAQDSAVRRYRARHPAADRASHAIVIYSLKNDE